MMTNAKVGAALVGGYLLGRTKKAKLAIGLGMFLAGKKLDLDPRAIRRFVTESPVIGAINTQVRDELLGATKSAATRALTQRVTGLADSLHERTRVIGGGSQEDDEEDAAHDEADDVEADEEPAPRRKSTARSAPSGAGRSSGTQPAKRAASGGKTAARKAPARKSTAKNGGSARTTTSGTRRTTGGDHA